MTTVDTVKILLVDDKQENHTALESIFEQDSYTFTKAYSGNEALKILLNHDDFALILMDVKMPGMNGFETASMIYKREKLSHIPIIFITSNDSEENLFKGYLSGGVDYIVKPINPELLKIKVRVFIELFKKNRELLVQKQKLDKMNEDLKNEIKEKLKIADELRVKNLQLADAQKLSKIGSWDWNLLTNNISGSDEIFNIYGFNNNNFAMEDFFAKVHPSDLEYVQSNIAESINSKKPFNIFFRYLPVNGETRYINKIGRAVLNEQNEVIKIFGTSQDITELKKTEEHLKIFSLFEKMLSEIFIFRQDDFGFLHANEIALRNIGCTINELNNLSMLDLLAESDKETFRKIISPLINKQKDKAVFFSNIIRRDTSSYPVEIHLQYVKKNAWDSVPSFQENVFLAVVLDLTERKRTETELASSLKEKEILIKEIHHRVKNNLQVISSLLNIQKSYINNRQMDKVIDESRDRIHSMALLHEKLYQSKNLSLINFKSYIQDLASNLLHTYSTSDKKIELEINSADENINIDLGISLGLILNEFISNSIKHGFKSQSDGKIIICFEKRDSNTYLLSVKDNGRGLDEDFDIDKTESLGLQLVKSLVEQIKGDLEIIRNSGTEFKILYPSDIQF